MRHNYIAIKQACGPVRCRAEGGCAFDYSRDDLAEARCAACGRRGHLSCAEPDQALPPWTPSCANCGRGGHTDADCPKASAPLQTFPGFQRLKGA